jgi:aquaporin Z
MSGQPAGERSSRHDTANAQREPEEPQGFRGELRRHFAELLGAFGLTFVAAGADVIARVSRGEIGIISRAVAPFLLVMAMIYSIGNVSGAHFNPAVTFAFALRRAFPWARVPGYWIAQMLGAMAAAGLLLILFGDVAHLGTSEPHSAPLVALVMEIVLTWILVSVILGTATRYRLLGPNAALAVGATIARDGLFALPISGASMNPARSIGPAIVRRTLHDSWIYLAGPFAGAALAVLTTWALHGRQKTDEEKVASGEGGHQAQSRPAANAALDQSL